MIWKLIDGETIFMIADGVGRTYQNLSTLSFDMRQTTQVSPPFRAEWPVAFPSRASRELSFNLPVVFPPCASLEEAFEQALDIPVQCPRGGELVGLLGAKQRSYSQAWVNATHVEMIGLTNLFNFAISAVNPTTATLSPLALMDPRAVANLHKITGLVGGTEYVHLDWWPTADVLPGFQTQIFAAIGELKQLATFRLIAGTDLESDATQTDPLSSSPVVVRPVDYDAEDPKVWVRLDA